MRTRLFETFRESLCWLQERLYSLRSSLHDLLVVRFLARRGKPSNRSSRVCLWMNPLLVCTTKCTFHSQGVTIVRLYESTVIQQNQISIYQMRVIFQSSVRLKPPETFPNLIYGTVQMHR